jgi:hypothetical protein
MPGKASQQRAAGQLADKMLRVLEAQRILGPASYPLTVQRLVELTDPHAPAALVKQALAKKTLQRQAILARAGSREAPVALVDDLDLLAACPLTLEFLLRAAATPASQAFTLAKLKEKATGKLKKPFQDAAGRRIADGTLPPTVGWVLSRGSKLLFLLNNLHTGHPPVPSARVPAAETNALPASFAEAFAAVFERLDRQQGGHNFVSLVELRRALPVPRAAFDAGLEQLRRQGRYALSAAEGRAGITPEERQAGIPEEGTLLLFASRNAP